MSLRCTTRRPRGVSNFHCSPVPAFSRNLPLPVATRVVNSTSLPCRNHNRLSAIDTTRYGRFAAESLAARESSSEVSESVTTLASAIAALSSVESPASA